MTKFNPYNSSSAVLSIDRLYRYILQREWDVRLRMLTVCGLNPSTADATIDDATIRIIRNFATRWGFGGFYMVNLFAFRATDPKEMKAANDPIGPECDDYILQAAKATGAVLAAWGRHGDYLNRANEVLDMLDNRSVFCLKPPDKFALTKNNQPRHPLFMPLESQPVLLSSVM